MSSVPATRNFGLTLPTSNTGGAFGRRATKQEKPQEPPRSRFNLTQLDTSVATVKAAAAAKPQEPARSRFNLSQLDISAAVSSSHAPQEPVRTRTFGALSNGTDGSMNAFGNRARGGGSGGDGNRGGDRIEFSEQAAAAFGKKVRKSDAPERSEATDKIIARMKDNTIWAQVSMQMQTKASEKAVNAPDTSVPAAAPPSKKSNTKKSAKKNAVMDDDLLDYVPTQHTKHSQYVFEDEESDNQDA